MGKTNFPDGISDAGEVTVRGTVTITGATHTVETGLSKVNGCIVSLGEDPGAGVGDVDKVTFEVGEGGDVALKIWQDDNTAATEDATVSFWIWGEE